MPTYTWKCRSCPYITMTSRSIHEPGSPPAPFCQHGEMVRDFSSIQVVANPVPWRPENRVSDDERKVADRRFKDYAKKAETLVEPKKEGKQFANMHEAYTEASRMLHTGEVRGVTPQQAAAEGIS